MLKSIPFISGMWHRINDGIWTAIPRPSQYLEPHWQPAPQLLHRLEGQNRLFQSPSDHLLHGHLPANFSSLPFMIPMSRRGIRISTASPLALELSRVEPYLPECFYPPPLMFSQSRVNSSRLNSPTGSQSQYPPTFSCNSTSVLMRWTSKQDSWAWCWRVLLTQSRKLGRICSSTSLGHFRHILLWDWPLEDRSCPQSSFGEDLNSLI